MATRDKLDICLTILDSLLAYFLFFPMVCLYWRGSWDLIGYYVLPDNIPLAYWIHAAIGSCTLVDYFIIPLLDRKLDRKRKVVYWLCTKALMAYHGILYMFLWRGVWMLADHYITRDWKWSLLALSLDLLLLLSMRVIRSTMWPPFMVCVDTDPDLLKAYNRFHTLPEKKCKYFFDSLLTALVVNYLAIFSWRCVWCIWDALLYPDDLLMSDIVSFACGSIGTTILFSLQGLLASISEHLDKKANKYPKLCWEGFIYVIIFVVLSALWRGGWNLNLRYIIPENPLGAWVNHICGAILFLIFQTYSLVGGCGCGIDGEDEGGGAFFPVQYLRLIFSAKLQQRKEKVQQKQAQMYRPPECRDDRRPQDFRLSDYMSKPQPITSVNQVEMHSMTRDDSPLYEEEERDPNDPWVLREDFKKQRTPYAERLKYYNGMEL